MAPNNQTAVVGRSRRRRRPCCTASTTTTFALAAAAAAALTSPNLLFVQGAHPTSIKKAPKTKHAPKIRGSRNTKTNNNNKNVGGDLADAAVAAEGVFPFRSSSSSVGNNNNSGGNSNRGNLVVVQPDSTYQQSAGGRNVQIHPWPHPDTFGGEEGNAAAQPSLGLTDFAGEKQLYGSTIQKVEYYQNGEASQSSSSGASATGSGSSNNSGGMHVANYNYGSSNINYSGNNSGGSSSSSSSSSSGGGAMDYQTWLESRGMAKQQAVAQARGAPSYEERLQYQVNHDGNSGGSGGYGQKQTIKVQQQAQTSGEVQQVAPAQGSSASSSSTSDITLNSQTVETDYDIWVNDQGYTQSQVQQSEAGSDKVSTEQNMKKKERSPLEDLDGVAGKQVILRPRLVDSKTQQMVLPPLGSSQSNSESGGDDNGEPVVYYYDPQALQSSQSSPTNIGDSELDAPELTLPEIVYDASGHALKLEQVHAGGRNEVYLEVKPKSVWGSDLSNLNDRLVNFQSKLQFNPSTLGNGANGSSGAQSQDQLIVLFTVATMAVMVGALSAQRLRSKKLLESCMHPEMDDEDWEVEEFGSMANNSSGKASAAAVATPRYDKKFDTDTGLSVGSSANGSGSSGLNSGGSGLGALLGGRNTKSAGYYGTANDGNGGGGLHWRGDMEKFDV